jgi:hypothetical protein
MAVAPRQGEEENFQCAEYYNRTSADTAIPDVSVALTNEPNISLYTVNHLRPDQQRESCVSCIRSPIRGFNSICRSGALLRASCGQHLLLVASSAGCKDKLSNKKKDRRIAQIIS